MAVSGSGESPPAIAVAERLSRGPAKVILLSKGGLSERLADVATGMAPADFFYGFPGLVRDGVDVRMQSTSAPYRGAAGAMHRAGERLWGRLTRISRRHHFLDQRRDDWRRAAAIVSFTDHFSLTLGDYFKGRKPHPFTIGLFHGLSDLKRHLTPLGRRVADGYVFRALGGLDHVGFMGDADRSEAIARYGLRPELTSVFRFGVDTAFWTPSSPGGGLCDHANDTFVLSVGSDPGRDYGTLVAADVPCHVRIVTRLPVDVPSGRTGVTVTSGNFFGSPLDDPALRDLYRTAAVVVVPLQDVFQPTGCSVTLQAMACGRPVVLSRNKGLWAPQLLRHDENCLLVPPGDPSALAAAIRRLLDDPELANRLGMRGRKLVEEHFSLAIMEQALKQLVSRADRQ